MRSFNENRKGVKVIEKSRIKLTRKSSIRFAMQWGETSYI